MLPPAPPRPAPPHEYVLLAGTVPSRPVPPRSPPRTNFSSSPPVPGAGRAVPRPGQRRAGRGRPAPPLRATAAATHSPVTGTTASRPPPTPRPRPPPATWCPEDQWRAGAAAAQGGEETRAGREALPGRVGVRSPRSAPPRGGSVPGAPPGRVTAPPCGRNGR